MVYQILAITHEELGDNARAYRDCLNSLEFSIDANRFRAIAWGLLKLATLAEKLNRTELSFVATIAAVKLHGDVATRQGEKAKPLAARLSKLHGDLFAQIMLDEKKTPWRVLAKRLVASGI
jgi:hypothetical protein